MSSAMQLEIFDIGVARRRRDRGEKAVLPARSEWGKSYAMMIGAWFESLAPGALFTGEDLRHHALITGLKRPHHHNAWSAGAGALIRSWMKTDRAEATGETVLARSAKTHAHALRQYRKLL